MGHTKRLMVISLLLVLAPVLLAACSSAPVYPGAVENKGGATTGMNINCFQSVLLNISRAEKTTKIDGEAYLTPDPLETVTAWYQEQVPDWPVVTECKDVTVFLSPAGCSQEAGNCTRLVAIFEAKEGGTWIGTYWRK